MEWRSDIEEGEVSDIIRLEEKVAAFSEARHSFQVRWYIDSRSDVGLISVGFMACSVLLGQPSSSYKIGIQRRRSQVILHGVVESDCEKIIFRRNEDLLNMASKFHALDCDDVNRASNAFIKGDQTLLTYFFPMAKIDLFLAKGAMDQWPPKYATRAFFSSRCQTKLKL